MPNTVDTTTEDKLIVKLKAEKKAAIEFRERKRVEWDENYELYRGKVKTNRLTQRQAVNIPLMKETVKTALSKIDDPPTVDWKEKSGDEAKEIIYQELWNEFTKKEKLDWIDSLDKKNVLLYGLSTKKLNLKENGITVSVMDTYDILYDPQTNPIDIESARFIIHQNIYRSLRECLADEKYTKDGKDKLRTYVTLEQGIVQGQVNKEEMEKKQERLKAMGVDQSDFALFGGGDVVVNITEHFYEKWDEKAQMFKRWVAVYADNNVVLYDELLMDCIGVEFWPFTMWAEDPETNDIYPDGVADLVRTPNKVINVWYSQLIENRTLRNFQMTWYDATVQGYQPQTYEPGPGRMLPAPGDPNKTLMPVEISGLDETLTAIDYLTKVVERGSGTTAIEKGQSEKNVQTLGEVQVLVGKSLERARGMGKFYRGSWYELAKKWDAMMQANGTKTVTLYKTGRSGKVYEKKVTPKDWHSEAGYEPTVASTSEQEEEQVKGIQKFTLVMQQFPNNAALKRIAQKRQLEILDLAPQELTEVQEEEERMQKMQAEAQAAAQQAAMMGAAQQPGTPGQPAPTPLGTPTAPVANPQDTEIASLMGELSALQ